MNHKFYNHSLYNRVFRNFALSLLFPVIIGGKENSCCILMQILSANLLHTQRSASSDNRFGQVPAVNLEKKAREHRHRLVVKFHSIERYPRSIHNWNQFALFVTVWSSIFHVLIAFKHFIDYVKIRNVFQKSVA